MHFRFPQILFCRKAMGSGAVYYVLEKSDSVPERNTRSMSLCLHFRKTLSPSECVDSCIDPYVGDCTRAFVVQAGKLDFGACWEKGYLVVDGDTHQTAFSCGEVLFNKYKKGSFLHPPVMHASFDPTAILINLPTTTPNTPCGISHKVEVGKLVSDDEGGGFPVRVSIAPWVPDALINVDFAPW